MKKYFVIAGLVVTISLYILFKLTSFPEYRVHTWPNLPSPIGKELVLITSAGQAVEGHILDKMTKQLHIDGDYRPRALATDIYDYKTVILVTGFSAYGLKETGRTIIEEKERIGEMLREIKKQNIPLIVIHLGGHGRVGSITLSFIKMALTETDYIIAQRNSDYHGELRLLAREKGIPITLVKDLDDIKTPLNSIFR